MLRQVCQPAGAVFLHIMYSRKGKCRKDSEYIIEEGETVCICMDLILEAQNVQ